MTRRRFLARIAASAFAAGSLLAGVSCTGPSLHPPGAPRTATPPPSPTSPAPTATAPPATPTQLPASPTPVPATATPRPIPPVARIATASPLPAPRQPNVLLITVDTVRADRVGAYGFK